MWKDDLFCRRANRVPRGLVAEQLWNPAELAREAHAEAQPEPRTAPSSPQIFQQRVRCPPRPGSLMAFPAVGVPAEKGPQSEFSPVWQERLCASDRRFLAAALMRCCLGSFQLLA